MKVLQLCLTKRYSQKYIREMVFCLEFVKNSTRVEAEGWHWGTDEMRLAQTDDC